MQFEVIATYSTLAACEVEMDKRIDTIEDGQGLMCIKERTIQT